MIGYAPHLKAYRLWDPASLRVFNSYHVTFFEHLDAMPSRLLPGTILGTDRTSSPPTWDITGLRTLSDPAPHPPLPSSFPFSSFSDDPDLPNEDQTNTLPSNPSIQSSTPTHSNNKNPPVSDNTSQNNTDTEEQHPNQEQQLPNQEQQLPQSLIPCLTIKIPP